jgi:hypothetical protein
MSLALHIIGWWFLISLALGPFLAWSFFWAAKDGNEIAPSEEGKPRLVYGPEGAPSRQDGTGKRFRQAGGW